MSTSNANPNPKLKIKAKTAQEIAAPLDLADPAVALIKPDITPLDYLDILIGGSHFNDAVIFLANALPKREAVWWANLAAREVLPPEPKKESAAAIVAAETWVLKPTEEHRRAAEAAAQKVPPKDPAHWTALAAFWSGGSIAPAGMAEVPPAPDLTARAVTITHTLAATADPPLTPTRYKQFLAWGLDIARGGTGKPVARS